MSCCTHAHAQADRNPRSSARFPPACSYANASFFGVGGSWRKFTAELTAAATGGWVGA